MVKGQFENGLCNVQNTATAVIITATNVGMKIKILMKILINKIANKCINIYKQNGNI